MLTMGYLVYVTPRDKPTPTLATILIALCYVALQRSNNGTRKPETGLACFL